MSGSRRWWSSRGRLSLAAVGSEDGEFPDVRVVGVVARNTAGPDQFGSSLVTAVAFEEIMVALRSEWRLDFRIVERILAELAHGGGTLSELVRATAIDRRAVEAVLERLGPYLDSTGGRFTLAGAAPVAAHPGQSTRRIAPG